MTVEEAAALVDEAAGADTAAIDALADVIRKLRRAQLAKAEIVARVPQALIRRVLLSRSAQPTAPSDQREVTP
jgi:hypothetical protein